MKLYTDQQLRYIYNCYDFNLDQDGSQIIDENKHFEQCIKTLTPIELPSDEEMGVIALNIASTLKDKLDSREEAFYLGGFQTCNQWLKKQILNQNK